jgi:hypothetical protein
MEEIHMKRGAVGRRTIQTTAQSKAQCLLRLSNKEYTSKGNFFWWHYVFWILSSWESGLIQALN